MELHTGSLRVLLVEDSADDEALIVRHCRRQGLMLDHLRVETAEQMREALREPWDAVIADYRLPSFSAPAALELLQSVGVDLPFIVVSGTIGEETAAAVMRAGAHDFVLKQNLARLIPVLRREVEQAAVRKQRKDAEAALVRSEANYRALLEQASDGIVTVCPKAFTILEANYRFCEMLGYDRSELEGAPFDLLLTESEKVDDPPRFDMLREGGSYVQERRYVRKDGSLADVETSAKCLADGRFFAIVRDISERKASEAARAYLVDALQRELAERTKLSYELRERVKEANCLYAVSRVLAQTELADDDMFHRVVDLIPGGWQFPEWTSCKLVLGNDEFKSSNYAESDWGLCQPVGGAHQRGMLRVYYTGERAERRTEFLAEEQQLLTGLAERISECLARREAEAERTASEAYFRSLIENAGDLITVLTEQGSVVYESPAIQRILGYDQKELVGRNVFELVHPDDLPKVTQLFQAGLVDPSLTPRMELRFVCKDGSWRHVECTASNLLAQPSVHAIVVNTRDIQDRKELEERLFQAQKMEAIGRLAGGIAHDFNNLLTVIQGHTAFLALECGETGSLRADVEEVRKAAERASALTQQLLAFSRRQILQARVVDVNHELADMQRLLGRVIGEDIELVTTVAPEPATTTVDPAQLQQVLMNLAVNARDAMPRGGRLSVSVAVKHVTEDEAAMSEGLRAGKHVSIIVSDTGCGIEGQVLEHIFEPFFTTKDIGQGTGLGLATVYGIVKQSDGVIDVRTEVGHGTTFEIILPWAEAVSAEKPERASRKSSSGATILLVEDEDGVRRIASRTLTRLGYTVIQAASGSQAIEAAASPEGANIDLLITDIVIPDMRGPEIARVITRDRNAIPVLYMSGYAKDVVDHDTVCLAVEHYLEKPFTIDALGNKVAEILAANAALQEV